VSAFESDFGIVTIVDEAREAAVALFDIAPAHWEDRLGLKWGVCLLAAADGGNHVVVVGQAVDRSNGPAFEAADAMLRAWRPRHLVVADIGAGFWGAGPNDRDGLVLGDVVVASDIEYFEVEKQIKGGQTKPRPYPIQLPSTGPRDKFHTMHHWCPAWHEPARAIRPHGAPDAPPKLLGGQIVCGEKLLSNPNSKLVARLVRTYDKALGVDMESAGAGRAVLARQREGIFAEFTVLRGVSDLFDKRDDDNQQIRDDWKPYAARVAVAAAKAWIVASPSSAGVIATNGPLPTVLGATLSTPRAARPTAATATVPAKYSERLREWLKDAALLAERTFRLKLQTTPHRAAITVATGEEGAPVERGEVLRLVLADRKVVVVGPSGAGKSVLLRQILRQAAAQQDPLVVHIDLKENWSPDWAAKLAELPDEATIDMSMGALLTASALTPSASDLAQLAADRRLILIVDALNEVPADVAEKIRLTLDQYVRFHDSVRILASDRRTEQFYRESRWTVLHLSGVTEDEARDVVDEEFGERTFDTQTHADRRLLCVPFFLDRAIRSRRVRLGSRATAVGDFLRDAGLAREEIDRTARCAFALYERGESVLNSDDTANLQTDGLLDRLRAAEITVGGASGLIFAHQLVHQFLAGRHLGSRPNAWTAETLDKVTAQAASLDAVGMTIAAIGQQVERDQFLRIVYDWNWRAAVLALIETQAGDRQVSEALATTILAMAAEKRFDAVAGTRARVEGVLREVPGRIAERMRALKSHADVIAEVSRMQYTDVPWWSSWRDLFVWDPSQQQIMERDIAAIGSSEPLIGWTVANSLRRFEPSEHVAILLRMAYRSHLRDEPGARATRWRVVHALGMWPSRPNAELLLEAVNDAYIWSVYGAVRSLVEMAARTHDLDLRSWIVEQLTVHWQRLPSAPLSQLAWTAVYRDTDSAWPGTIRPLLETVRTHQTGGERERWDRRLERFEAYAKDHIVKTP
jgi:nucleoside phosphorylase